MKVTETKIPGVLIIDTDVFGDHRVKKIMDRKYIK